MEHRNTDPMTIPTWINSHPHDYRSYEDLERQYEAHLDAQYDAYQDDLYQARQKAADWQARAWTALIVLGVLTIMLMRMVYCLAVNA